MAARNTTRKAAAKKTVAKKSAEKVVKPRVKVIQTIDSEPGKDTVVYFTDGTRAVIEAGNKLADMLSSPEFVAPNLIQVTMSGKNIVEAEPVRVDTSTDDA